MEADEYSSKTNHQFLLLKKHIKLIRMSMEMLPRDYSVLQTSRPTLLYFLISSLDLLGQLENVLNEGKLAKTQLIDWIYSLQLERANHKCGFRGSFVCSQARNSHISIYDSAHLAQTYTSLCTLLILGDDLSRVDRPGILGAIRYYQREDGSFCATEDSQSENDMRFVFCAAAICYILDDFSSININSLCTYIRRSISYDGGIGQAPGLESHGGSTFCAIASLALIGRLWDGSSALSTGDIERLKQWTILKQTQGFHGRIGKIDDSCYAFWLGATLTILNAKSLVNWPSLRTFLLGMQDKVIGGFCKYDESLHSDLLHTNFSLAAFGCFGEPFVRPIFPPLIITTRTHEHLQRLKAKWKLN